MHASRITPILRDQLLALVRQRPARPALRVVTSPPSPRDAPRLTQDPHFHTGWSAAGLHPAPRPPFRAWRDAQHDLVAAVTDHSDALACWAGTHSCDFGRTCPVYGDSCAWRRAEALVLIRDSLLTATPDTAWCGTADGIRYALEPCTDGACRPS